MNGAGTHSPNRFPLRLPVDEFYTALHFMLILGVLAGGIVTAGYGYWRSQERHYRVETEQALAVVADYKVSELTHWREERMGDAALFFKNPSFSALVQRVFAQPADADAQRQLHDWLAKYPTLDDYDQVRLMDTQAVTRLSLPGGLKPATADTVRAAAEAARSGQPTLLDFYRHEHDSRVYLSVQIPLFEPADTNRPLGVLVLRIDPEKYLYPIITRWPKPDPTAETMLIRRDGDHVLYLNDIRHQPDAALALRVPLTRTDIPAVRAALGQTGFMAGPDYRGVPVTAIGRGVPDSPWIIIAKTDAAEAGVPLERLWQGVVMIAVLLFGTGASAWLIWRRKAVRHYREQARSADLIHSKSEELKRFTYAVSHDLRSPVVTIQTFLDHLEQDIPARNAARVADDLTFIHTAVNQMARLLDELLKLSRLGHQANPPGKVLLQAVVKEAMDLTAGQIEQRGAQVSVVGSPVTLHGDRTRFVALFQNLVDNACKFMGDRKDPRIEIGAETRDAETVFFVRDNGIGVDPRHQEKMFDLFEKLDPKTEGSGLGLALVRRIVELYAGRIWVESAGSGQGTCFYFTLPEAKPGS